MPTLAIMTSPMSLACSECGTVQKSGKSSCCGRGGSWFGNCGSVRNRNLGHTWHEGIQACKTRQFQASAEDQIHERKRNASSADARMGMDSKAIIVAAHMLKSTPITTVIPRPVTTPVTATANISTIMPARTSMAHDTDALTTTTPSICTSVTTC